VRKSVTYSLPTILPAFLLFAFCFPASALQVRSAPATSTAPATQVADAATLATGIKDALAGRFDRALRELRRAAAQAADPIASRAASLIEDYLAVRQEGKAERLAEYERAVLRVRRSMLAQRHLPKLIAAGLVPDSQDEPDRSRQARSGPAGFDDGRDFRQAVRAVASAYSQAANIDALELACDQEADELKAEAAEALEKASAGLAEARKMLADDRSEYAETFAALADVLSQRLLQFRRAWAAVDTTSPAGRLAGAKRLRNLEDSVTAAVGDVEAMAASKPWRIGLIQARTAKDLAGPEVDLAAEDWYSDIKAMAESKGREAMRDARWYDALAAYLHLSKLEEDNQRYKQQLKTVRRHVRVLSLYGKPDSRVDEAQTQPREQATSWQELVSGVDGRMVRDVISEISYNYVSRLDYRKVARGALNAIKILAETPQAAFSFPGLTDERSRREFVAAVDREIETVERQDRVEHEDLQDALHGVLRASQRTVKIPLEVLAVEFAEGMLDELDRFSSMIWPHDVPDFMKQTTGKFFGVGIQITKEPGEPLKVVTPLAGSPAYRQGIKSGDTIVAVDGKRTELFSIEKLVSMITGPKGTRVVLSIQRPGIQEAKDFSIIREEIRIHTVKGWRRLPGGDWDFIIDPAEKIGYVRITQFTERTVTEVDEVLDGLAERQVRSLVVDLRYNPGGMLQAATGIADEFLSKGTLVSTRGRPTRPSELVATPKGRYLHGDLVVLVNGLSASAAEILSGAIKDWKRGIVVGERTFGKGSVQHLIPIRPKRALLKLTAAYYYLPSGRLLHRENNGADWGVNPDVEISMTPKQTKRWLELQRKTDLLKDIDPEILAEELREQLAADHQLQAAMLLLKLMRLGRSRTSHSSVPSLVGAGSLQ